MPSKLSGQTALLQQAATRGGSVFPGTCGHEELRDYPIRMQIQQGWILGQWPWERIFPVGACKAPPLPAKFHGQTSSGQRVAGSRDSARDRTSTASPRSAMLGKQAGADLQLYKFPSLPRRVVFIISSRCICIIWAGGDLSASTSPAIADGVEADGLISPTTEGASHPDSALGPAPGYGFESAPAVGRPRAASSCPVLMRRRGSAALYLLMRLLPNLRAHARPDEPDVAPNHPLPMSLISCAREGWYSRCDRGSRSGSSIVGGSGAAVVGSKQPRR